MKSYSCCILTVIVASLLRHCDVILTSLSLFLMLYGIAFRSLSSVLLRSKKYKGSLETLMVQHVLPEFHSPVG